MRFLIPQYIFKHGILPKGSDFSIIDPKWGTSYGFTPIFTYIVSAVFMKITSFFAKDFRSLLYAARLPGVLWGMGTAYFALKMSKRLIDKKFRWIFVGLVVLLPQFLYLSTYVNCDSFAIFSASMTLYACIIGPENDWNIKSRTLLAIGISACLLSYYNTYGMVLCSMIYYVVTSGLFRKDNTDRKKEWKKFLYIIAIILLLAGWWFIRSAIINKGDVLGLASSNRCGELYAQKGYKPSQRWTPVSRGVGFFSMIGKHLWFMQTYCSFIGLFGYMTYWISNFCYTIYSVIYSVGFLGIILKLIKCIREKVKITKERILFHALMLSSIVMPISISLIYSYFFDFQAQGRYIMPMLLPFMYYLARGIEHLIVTIFKNEKTQKIITTVVTAILIFTLITVLIQTVYPMLFHKKLF